MTDEAERQATTDALNAGAEKEERAIQAEESAHAEAPAVEAEPLVEDSLPDVPEADPVVEESLAAPSNFPTMSSIEPKGEDPRVVGSIEPASEAEQVAKVLPPFPHSLTASHAVDEIQPKELVRKTTATGYSWDRGASFSDGNLIRDDDALAHLPIGSTLEKNDGGQIVMTMPATDTRGPFLTYGKNVHTCIAQAWPWLVGEGHAKVPATP